MKTRSVKEKGKKSMCISYILANRKEEGIAFLISILATSGIAYIFYNSVIASILFLGVYPMIYHIRKKEAEKTHVQQMKIKFKEMIQSLEAILQAGHSVEKAMVLLYEEMKGLHGEKCPLVMEIAKINKEVETNIPIENAFFSFAMRCEVEEIMDFANTFAIGKRIGGDLGKVIADTVFVLSEKIDTEREIEVHLAARKFEFFIMCSMPFCIILYIRLASPGYFSILYKNLFGILFMTGILGIMGGSYILGQNLLEVKI